MLPLSRRAVRGCVGALWLLDAALQGQPHLFTRDWLSSDLAQSVMGQPPEINHSIYSVINLLLPAAAAWNAVFVLIQAALGLALTLGRFERAAIVASIGWALGVWWVGEGFGGLPTGFALLAAGSPGAVLFYPLLGLLAWPSSRPADSSIAWRAGASAWVVVWAGQAVLHLPWKFSVGEVLSANVEEHSLGEPRYLLAISHHTEAVIATHPVAVTIFLAVVEVAVGVGVLFRSTRRSALAAAIGLSLVYWVAFQYFGALFAGDATDPGSAPLLIIFALALWPRELRREAGVVPDHRDRVAA